MVGGAGVFDLVRVVGLVCSTWSVWWGWCVRLGPRGGAGVSAWWVGLVCSIWSVWWGWCVCMVGGAGASDLVRVVGLVCPRGGWGWRVRADLWLPTIYVIVY